VSLKISTRQSADVTILDLQGRSTIEGESDLLSRHLKKSVSKGVRKLLLNLEDLTQIDSSGVGVIVATYVSIKNLDGGDLKLLSPRARVLDVLRVLHLTDVIPCFATEAQALASFHPHGYAAAP
jgi:anti-anti-sigma factor